MKWIHDRQVELPCAPPLKRKILLPAHKWQVALNNLHPIPNLPTRVKELIAGDLLPLYAHSIDQLISPAMNVRNQPSCAARSSAIDIGRASPSVSVSPPVVPIHGAKTPA